ncbi:lipase maturation factor family protein [Nitriliruptor alkaliphilus]|uniref:lipase maturation factor family protein n=1 Tax=Nitriliruptor alkaliphilus TaxID=427918 RepID=UPI000695F657|nr:lipase maturation factor family protein [Nitriliruptor alkaliphilus]
MEVLSSNGGEAARWLVQRGVALTCLIAFANIVRQWVPLLGTAGLTPVTEVLRERPSLASPSLFHLRYSDRLAVAGGWVGVAVATSLVVGLPQRGPAWLPLVAFLVLWVLYLSYVTVGRIWYAFGWESLLLEATFLAAFLGSDTTAPPLLTLWLLRWLVIRVEVGAGLIKWRGDPCWRALTCLEHHHQTQPLPAPASWWFHHLPLPLHRVEALANHVVQLVVPAALLLPQPVAGAAAVLIVVTQLWLMASGNFSWLNLLTIVLACSALPDAWFAGTPLVTGEVAPTPSWLAVVSVVLAVVVAGLSLRGPVPNLLSPRQRMNASHDPLRLVNSYGAFGSVTKVRYELEIEATADDPDDRHAAWRRYRFAAKPGPVERRPPQVAPRHLRLDWLLWFAAMDPSPLRHRWFEALLRHLLAADPAVLRLLAHDPNGGQRPAAVRVVRERTRFTTPAERRRSGHWWVREDGEQVVPPLRLADGRLTRG